MSNRWQWRLLGLGFLLSMAGIAGHRVAQFARPGELQSGSSRLVPDQAGLDLGEVWETTDFHWLLPVRNEGGNEIQVREWVTSCNCTGVLPRALTIAPGQRQVLQIPLDLTRQRGVPDATGRRPFEMTIQPRYSEPGGENDRWSLRGIIRSAVVIDQSAGDVGVVSDLAERAEWTIPIQVYVALAHLEAKCSSSTIRLSVTAPSEDSQRRLLKVESIDRLPIGPFRFDVRLKAASVNGKVLPEKSITLSGRVASDLMATPSVVHFGAHALGATVEELVTIQSRIGMPIRVRDVRSVGKGLSVVIEPVGSSPGLTVRVKQCVNRVGESENKVILHVVRGRQPLRIEVPVVVHGHSVEQ